MATFRTALGDEYTIERRLPRLAWRPRYRGLDPSLGDFGGAVDDGILGIVGAILLVFTLAVVVLPLLLFVAEVAAIVAVVVPVVLFGIATGAVRHTVIVRSGGKTGPVIASRQVRGIWASVRARRELRADAEAGRLRSAAVAQELLG